MRLFRKKAETPLNRLLSNLEKIGKVSALRISKDYTDSVVDDLNWIQANFISLLTLRDTDEHHFFSLIDPNGYYKKSIISEKEFGDIDFANFSMSLIDQLPPEQEIDPMLRKYETVYSSFEPDKVNDLILRYIQTIFTIWNAAMEKDNRLIQKYCLHTFVNWITIIDRIDDDDVDYSAILKTFLENLMYRNFSVLDNNSDLLPGYVSLFSYDQYLNRIFSDNINKDNIEIYFDYLFRFLYQVTESKKYQIVEQFISRCIDSSYYPGFRNNYSDLYSLIHRKMQDAEFDDVQERLKRIPELGLYRLNYIETISEYNEWEKTFDEYIDSEIKTHIELDNEIEKQIKGLKAHAFNIYKFNRLQITSLKLLSLCLFKGNYSSIKHALSYNQPPDSNAIQGNKDILPVTLREILNAISAKYKMEHELMGFWRGHHGIEPYLDQLLCILFYRYRPRGNYGEENIRQATKDFCKSKLFNEPGAVEGLKQHVERLKHTFNFQANGGKLQAEFFTDPAQVAKTDKIFGEIIESCQDVLNNLEENLPISEETKTRFLKSIIEGYHKYNYLNQFFKIYGRKVDIEIGEDESFGINQMMDRTAFINNWHIPYVGFIEGHSRDLADSENRDAQFSLLKNVQAVKLERGKIGSTLSEYAGKDYVAIIRNLHLDMIMHEDEYYTPVYRKPKEDNNINGFYQGSYKDLPVFGLYDQLFSESLIIIKKNDLKYNENTGEVKEPFEMTQDFKTSFIDFGSDEASLEKMINNPPLWLEERFKENSDKLPSFLRKKVWVRMFKRSHFERGDEGECLLFEII